MGFDPSDNDLAKLAAKGDGDAFQALLERHYDRVFRIAVRFTGNREDAEDVAQDVCMSLPAKLKTFRGEASFTTWLYRVVVNRVRDVQRKQRDQLVVFILNMAKWKSSAAPLRKWKPRKKIEWLNQAMGKLSDDLRETAVLVVGEGLNHSEAGEVLNSQGIDRLLADA